LALQVLYLHAFFSTQVGLKAYTILLNTSRMVSNCSPSKGRWTKLEQAVRAGLRDSSKTLHSAFEVTFIIDKIGKREINRDAFALG